MLTHSISLKLTCSRGYSVRIAAVRSSSPGPGAAIRRNGAACRAPEPPARAAGPKWSSTAKSAGKTWEVGGGRREGGGEGKGGSRGGVTVARRKEENVS